MSSVQGLSTEPTMTPDHKKSCSDDEHCLFRQTRYWEDYPDSVLVLERCRHSRHGGHQLPSGLSDQQNKLSFFASGL